MGVIYTLLGLLFAPFVFLASMASPDKVGFGIGLVIAIPVLYGIAGFIFTAIGAALYNLVAGWVGGIEVELEAVNPTG